jgi:inosose dehydratase
MNVDKLTEIGTQAYGWSQIAEREGKEWPRSQAWAMEQATQAGLRHWEPLLDGPTYVEAVAEAARRNGMGLHSIYLGGNLHDPDIAPKTIETMVATAREARRHGSQLAVVNPNPIDWSSKQDKSDRQLSYQLDRLTELATALKGEGLTLCYHTHDAEMRQGAREFHHMLLNSDPQLVKLCLDPHWIYRGAGNSQVALLDIIKLYGDRIAEIHVRQSRDGVWDETVGPGDLDYARVVSAVVASGSRPFLVVEHALEAGTPRTLEHAEAHRRSRLFIEDVFAPLAA